MQPSSTAARLRSAAGAALLACTVAASAPTARAADDAATVTAQGEIVDLACYLPRGDKGRGPAHQECAELCAKGGAPLGLLASDGTLLLLFEDHAKPAPYADVKKLAGSTAEIQGTRFSRGGVNGLMVAAVKQQ
jgi:hypothetical protein